MPYVQSWTIYAGCPQAASTITSLSSWGQLFASCEWDEPWQRHPVILTTSDYWKLVSVCWIGTSSSWYGDLIDVADIVYGPNMTMICWKYHTDSPLFTFFLYPSASIYVRDTLPRIKFSQNFPSWRRLVVIIQYTYYHSFRRLALASREPDTVGSFVCLFATYVTPLWQILSVLQIFILEHHVLFWGPKNACEPSQPVSRSSIAWIARPATDG